MISDERSAGFIGLGIAQATKTPVALTCTSGTALLNYGPAVAEAFFNQIPLLVISADRPPEWIGQRDGQTINQPNALSNHVKASYNLPVDDGSESMIESYTEVFRSAYKEATTAPFGPVHINIPFKEPFYPDGALDEIDFKKYLKNELSPEDSVDFSEIQEKISSFEKVLVVAGQSERNNDLSTLLEKKGIPIVSDIISNYGHLPHSIHHQDVFLRDKKNTLGLHPDLVITIGMSVISKNLKLFLRGCRKLEHWHIDPDGSKADTYEHLTESIICQPELFFKKIEINTNSAFLENWKAIDQECKHHIEGTLLTAPFNEFSVVQKVMMSLPENSVLHLGNSTPVRYANIINSYDKSFDVHCNRGTSGIDGSMSTAYGSAMVSKRPHFIILGDMSFMYDRNAFWNNYLPNNLKVIILNNAGGGIFRLINGPTEQPELEKYFVTEQKFTAENTLKDIGVAYFKANDYSELSSVLPEFLANSGPAAFEVFTDPESNTKTFKDVMKFEKTKVR